MTTIDATVSQSAAPDNKQVSQPTFIGFDEPQQNWAKLPFSLTDYLYLIDTQSELKVVIYILRHTWGYREYGESKTITIDEFCNGRKRQDGSRIDPGTGLSEPSVRAGIEKAIEHGFVTCDCDETDLARIKKSYCLKMKPSTQGVSFFPPEPVVEGEKEIRGKDSLPRSESDNSPYKELSTTLSTGVAVEQDSDAKPVAIQTEPAVATVQAVMPFATPAPEPILYRAIHVIVPEDEEIVVEGDVPDKTRTKKGRKRKEGVTPAECMNPMKAAIMKAFNWTWDSTSKSEKGQVYQAAKQLCEVNFPVDQIPKLYKFCAEKFDDFGPVALTKHQSDFRKEQKAEEKPHYYEKVKAVSKPVVPSRILQLLAEEGLSAVTNYNIDLAYYGIDPVTLKQAAS